MSNPIHEAARSLAGVDRGVALFKVVIARHQLFLFAVKDVPTIACAVRSKQILTKTGCMRILGHNSSNRAQDGQLLALISAPTFQSSRESPSP